MVLPRSGTLQALQESRRSRGGGGAAAGHTIKRREFPRVAETGVAWESSVGIVTCVFSVAGVSGHLCMWQSYGSLLHLLPRPSPAKVAGPTAVWTLCSPRHAENPAAGPALPFLSTCSGSDCSLQSGSAGGESPATSFAKMTQHKI